jgi:uncharacterized protein (TIGR03067 family)
MLRWFVAAAIAACVCICGTAPAYADLGLNDFRQMQGSWTLVYAENDGMQFSYDVSGLGRLFVRGDRYKLGPQTPGASTGQFALNGSRWPRQINYTPMTGPRAGQTMLGIYEILGDTHKVCFAAPGQPRPTNFSTTPGTGQMNYVWLRTSKPSPAASRFRNVAPEFDFEVR